MTDFKIGPIPSVFQIVRVLVTLFSFFLREYSCINYKFKFYTANIETVQC